MLKYTAGHINYGGRVTDDWDRRCIMNILNDYYCPAVLNSDHKFSESGVHHQLEEESPHEVRLFPLISVKIKIFFKKKASRYNQGSRGSLKVIKVFILFFADLLVPLFGVLKGLIYM